MITLPVIYFMNIDSQIYRFSPILMNAGF